MTTNEFEDLIAADAPTFLANLRRFADKSPRTRGQIALVSGLPRSTVYHFTSEKNTALPKKPEQVRAFLTACKLLSDAQIDTVMRNWRNLTEAEEGMKSALRRPVTSGLIDPARDAGPVGAPHNMVLDDDEVTVLRSLVKVTDERLVRRKRRIRLISVFLAVALTVAMTFVIGQAFVVNRTAGQVQDLLVRAETGVSETVDSGTGWYNLADYVPSSKGEGFSPALEATLGGRKYSKSFYGRSQVMVRDGVPPQENRAEWTLGGRCTMLSATIGPNDGLPVVSGGSSGSWSPSSARFVVNTDGTPVLTADRSVGDRPYHFVVDIRGATLLTLYDYAPKGNPPDAWGTPQVLCIAPPGARVTT